MRTMRFGRSRWQRRAGAVASLAAGALVLASCSSGPKGVNALGPPAKPPTKAAVVKTVQFPSGPVAEHIYGPSWARFVAAFPGKVVVTGSGTPTPCQVGSAPAYDATAGTPLTGSNPKPPSYDVLVFRCGSESGATAFVRGSLAALATHPVVIDGVSGQDVRFTRSTYGPRKGAEWAGGYVFRVGAIVYVSEAFVASLAPARAFMGSFHFHLAGYTSAPVK